MPWEMSGISYTLWSCSVGVSCARFACSSLRGSVFVRPVEDGWFPLGMVPLARGTRQSPASSITTLIIEYAKNSMWTSSW